MDIQDRDVEYEVLREMGIDLAKLTELGNDPENETADTAMRLLGQIREEFADEPFTLKDIGNAFNSLTLDPGQSDKWDVDPDLEDDDTTNDEENRCFTAIQVDFDEEHLDYLVNYGYLVYDSENETYTLSDTSRDAVDVLDFSS